MKLKRLKELSIDNDFWIINLLDRMAEVENKVFMQKLKYKKLKKKLKKKQNS